MSKTVQMMMMLAAIVGLLAGVSATAGETAGTSEALVSKATPAVVEVEEMPESEVDAMLASGWYGIPGDGCECLYEPVGQVQITEPLGGVAIVEQDGSVTHITYSDGSIESITSPTDYDAWLNLYESIGKGCVASNLFEDFSCKGPEYVGYDLI